MKTIEFSMQEITYLLLSLRNYEKKLLADKSEDLEDAATDLIFVQSLMKKLNAAKAQQYE